jgi:hypothetical protein
VLLENCSGDVCDQAARQFFPPFFLHGDMLCRSRCEGILSVVSFCLSANHEMDRKGVNENS